MSEQLTQVHANEVYSVQELETYCLVDGIFDPTEATEVLMTLITDKIRYHQRRNLTSFERCGEPDPHSTRRIDELRQCKAELAERIAVASAAGQRVAIRSTIDVTPVDG